MVLALFLTGCGAQPAVPALKSNTPVVTTGAVLPTTPKDEIVCTQEYSPVCGKYQVQCITTPCDPVDKTYTNRCEAMKDGATNIQEGACAMD